MTHTSESGILKQTRARVWAIAEQESLLDADVTVLARPLTPQEAIGNPGRRDFPIIIGKERVVEAVLRGSRGHAYTDSPKEFVGTLKDVLNFGLGTNQERAIYVATINALLGRLEMVDRTVHCKDEEPEECAVEIAATLLEKYGRVKVGLIGLNPAILERLVDSFGRDHVHVTDLNRDNIGQLRFGVEVWDGDERTEDLIDASDVVVFTGTTLVNNTFDRIWSRIQARRKNYVVYGVTAAAVSLLLGIDRVCPRGRNASDLPSTSSG